MYPNPITVPGMAAGNTLRMIENLIPPRLLLLDDVSRQKGQRSAPQGHQDRYPEAVPDGSVFIGNDRSAIPLQDGGPEGVQIGP